jgi:hypothetical protein
MTVDLLILVLTVRPDTDLRKPMAQGYRLYMRQLGKGLSISRLVVPAGGQRKMRKPNLCRGLEEAEITRFAS